MDVGWLPPLAGTMSSAQPAAAGVLECRTLAGAPTDSLDSPKGFVLGLFARAVLLLLAAISLNVLVDPFGAHGTNIFEPITLGSRQPKLRLYHQMRPPPDVVILGSSRGFTMEAGYLGSRAAKRAFNAAVHAARLTDYTDFVSCFERAGAFPSILIVGLGVEQMLGDGGRPIEHNDPLASCRSDPGRPLELLGSHAGALGIQETWGSLRTLALEVTGRPAPTYAFASDGTFRSGYHAPLDEALETGLAGNWSPRSFAAETVDARAAERLRRLLEACRNHRARAVIFLPPYHPRAVARYMKESNFSSLKNQLLGRLGEWAERYPLRYYDFTDATAFGGSPDMFYDASHPREDAYRLMTDVMLRDLD